MLFNLFLNISLNCLAKEKSLQDGPWGEKKKTLDYWPKFSSRVSNLWT